MTLAVLIVLAFPTGNFRAEELPSKVVGGLQSPWENAKLRGVAFRAIGQEPSWFLEITEDESIYLFRGSGETGKRLTFREPMVDKELRLTVFTYPDESLEVRIQGKPCTDIMSGEQFSVSVTVTVEDEVLHGCGRALY